MTMFRRFTAAALAAFLLALTPAVAPAQSSNPNCTLAGCVQNYTQNGIQSFVKTYSFSKLGVSPSAFQDILVLQGSATKTIRVTKIVVTGGTATAAGFLNPLIIRESALGAGGTSSTQTAAARDTTNSAATGTLTLYTATPAAGTVVSTMDSCRLFFAISTSPATPDVCAFTYGINNDQMPTLRGTGDFIAVNFGGVTQAGAVADLFIEWTEEP